MDGLEKGLNTPLTIKSPSNRDMVIEHEQELTINGTVVSDLVLVIGLLLFFH